MTQLKRDIATYEANLRGLRLPLEEGGLDGDEIINMFIYRDAIEDTLNRGEGHILDVFRVIELDERLRRQAKQVVERLDLVICRRDLRPHKAHWWWYLDEWLADQAQIAYQPQRSWPRVAERSDSA